VTEAVLQNLHYISVQTY